MIPCKVCGKPSFGVDGLCTEHRAKGPTTAYPDGPGYSNATTSKDAAASIEPVTAAIAKEILTLITLVPRTCHEIETATQHSHQTASARITWLKQHGYIEDSGHRRKTPSNRDAIVWKAKEKA